MIRFPSRAVFIVALCAIAVVASGRLAAQASKPTEYEVQAAYLSNFGRFVEWPAGTPDKDPFYVCVLGQDPFGALLDAALKGESIGGVPLEAKRIAEPAEAANCRIIYVNPAKENQVRAALAALKNTSALTVGENADFIRYGGMIQFVLDGNRVRFEINLAAAQRARLALSSELLKVAAAIRRAP